MVKNFRKLAYKGQLMQDYSIVSNHGCVQSGADVQPNICGDYSGNSFFKTLAAVSMISSKEVPFRAQTSL